MSNSIAQNVMQILSELPAGVQLVAAVKTRSPQDILEAAEAGVRIVGENYIQETERVYQVVGEKVAWHFIGHLQKNKVKRAVRLFDMIETVDSVEIAEEINKRCAQVHKVMPLLVEVNSGREEQKSGVFPEEVKQLVQQISTLPYIHVVGLMTMGPRFGNPEKSRSYFIETRKIFQSIEKLNLSNIDMKYLSMGMTNSYRVAIEEGANIVRIGSKIFGEKSRILVNNDTVSGLCLKARED